MDGSLELVRRCAIAMPLVRAKAGRLAAYFQLHPFDRDDLEQELWLELLIRWDRRGSACAKRPPRFSLFSRLKREIDEVAISLIRSHSFWHRMRPARQRADTSVLEYATDASVGHEPTRAHELRLDVASVIVQLPAELRETCRQIAFEELPGDPPRHTHGSPAGPDAQIAALRKIFKSLDLHEYL